MSVPSMKRSRSDENSNNVIKNFLQEFDSSHDSLKLFFKTCREEGIPLKNWKQALEEIEEEDTVLELTSKPAKEVKELFTGTWIQSITDTLIIEYGSFERGEDYRYDKTTFSTSFQVYLSSDIQLRFSAYVSHVKSLVKMEFYCNLGPNHDCVEIVKVDDICMDADFWEGISWEHSVALWKKIQEVTGKDFLPQDGDIATGFPFDSKRTAFQSLFWDFLKTIVSLVFSHLDEAGFLQMWPSTEEDIAWSKTFAL